jgi:hypothetical protein
MTRIKLHLRGKFPKLRSEEAIARMEELGTIQRLRKRNNKKSFAAVCFGEETFSSDML